MKKPSLLTFLFLFFIIRTLGQDLPVKYQDIDSGLSNNSVACINQDHNGYMWFGTFDGLTRYDGHDYKIYRNSLKDPNSIPGNAIGCIEVDSKNNLWIGCSSGPTLFNQISQSFSPLYYHLNNKIIRLNTNTFQILNIPKTDKMLVATRQMLVAFNNGSTVGSPIALEGKLNFWCQAIAYDNKKSSCYVFVNYIGLCRLDLRTNKMYVLNKSLIQANCLMLSPEGLWIGTDKGAYLYDEKNNSYSKNYFADYRKVSVRDFLKEHTNILIATDGAGVYVLPKNGKNPVPYNPACSKKLLNSKSVYDIFESKNGEKWFATLRGGISMMGKTPLSFNTYKYDEKEVNKDPENNFMLSFCEDEKKNIWIGTEGAGLRYWDRQRNTNTIYKTTENNNRKILSDFITGIIRDSLNNIWVAMWKGGVCRIDSKTKSIKNYPIYNHYNHKEEPHSWLIHKDSKNRLWLAVTNEGALYQFNKALDKFICYDPKLINLTCFYESSDGKFWSGDLASNLICIDSKTHTSKRYPINYTARCVLEDNNKNLWIGTTEGGLILFDRKNASYKRYTKDDGLPNNTILRMLKDSNGNLWMSTYDGICKFNPKQLTFNNFYASDGLQSNQFNWNASTSLSSGEFIFGGINGFNIFNPDKVKESMSKGIFLLNELLIDNQPLMCNSPYVTKKALNLMKDVELPFDKSTFSLDFVYLDYINSDKINFAYLLEGSDKEWNYSGKNHRANYSQLHEGTYTFKVKATDINGRWKMASSLITITILPPWYRTWWAYCFYLLSITGIIYSYLLYNKNKERLHYEVKLAQLERKKEKEISEKQLSMFTFMAHELRTPLSLIINPLKKIVKNNTDKSEQNSDLNIAYKNARRLLSLTDQLLLFRKADSDEDKLKLSIVNLTELCKEIYQFFISQAKELKLSYTIALPSHDINIQGDYEKIEIAIFNILSNAFKYTPEGGTITLELIEGPNDTTISVKDTGIGIKENELETIFEKFRQTDNGKIFKKGFGIGLYVSKYFISKHQGNISCNSIFGEGTTFSIAIPNKQKLFNDSYNITNQKRSDIIEGLLENSIEEKSNLIEEITQKTNLSTPDNMVSNKRSILIVDDNPEIKNYLVSLFSNNYIVNSAEDGIAGLKLIKKLVPDLLLSDISMGGLDGIELCKAVKQNPELSHIPVILLTATTNPQTQLLGLTEGADDYITKPFDDEILIARVEAMLRSRNQLRSYFLDSITLKENNNKVPEEYREFLTKCIDIVEKNLTNKNFNLKSFSAQMGMSHSTLYKKIKTVSGETANSFIRSIRLRRGALLLLTENLTIAQVGSNVGIEDTRYFRQLFTNLFGMTPSEYIKKYRNSFNKDLNIIQNISDEDKTSV